MLENIQVPEPINHMPDINPQVRHFKKWALLIGIPLLIIVIVTSVYYYSLQPRFSASKSVQQPETQQSQKPLDTGVDSLIPGQNQSLLPGQSLNTEEYKKYFETLNSNLVRYDALYQNIKVKGQCYSSAQDTNASRDSWLLSINSILNQKVPEIASSTDSSKEELDKFKQVKDLTQNYNQEIKNFIQADKQVYDQRLSLNKVLFKICDGAIDQIENNCKDLPTAIENYKKSFDRDLNKDLISNLDFVIQYCSEIPEIIKSDNDAKFNDLNNNFSSNYSKIVSTCPNLQDKIKIVKDLRDKISNALK